MQRLLLLYVLLLSLSAGAQRELMIHPFEDYGNCTTGFINDNGDTIWQAEFEQIYHPVSAYNHHSKHWAAVYLGKTGLISPTGKTLLPFEFTHISMTFQEDVFFAEKNGKTGIIRSDGSIVMPFELDKITHFNNYEYLFVQNGKYGILDSSNRVKIPAVYDAIDLYDYTSDYSHNFQKTIYYLLEKEGKYGLAGSDGTLYFADSPYSFSLLYNPLVPTQPLLQIYKPESGNGLATLDNKLLIEPRFYNLSLFTLMNEEGHSQLYALGDLLENKQQVFDLTNGRSSGVYDLIQAGSHAMIFSKGRKQGILTGTLEEQPIRSGFDLRIHTSGVSFYEEENFPRYLLPFIPGSSSDAVLVLADSEKQNHYYSYDKSYGLINVQTRKTVKPRFGSILPKTTNHENFYFAFPAPSETEDTGSFVVFRSDLSVAGSFHFSTWRFTNQSRFFSTTGTNDPALLFINEHGKAGAISPDGTIAIPFVYDELESYIQYYFPLPEQVLFATKGTHHGIIDWTGKERIPVIYPIFYSLPMNYYIAGAPENMRLYSPTFDVLLDSCQYLAYLPTTHLLNYFNPMDSLNRNDVAVYAVKNDTAYALYADGLRPLNTRNYSYYTNATHQLIANHLLVERSGKCLLYKNSIAQLSDKLYYFMSDEGALSLFHTDKGVTLTVSNAHVRNYGDGYVHILQNTHQEGLASLETGEWILPPDAYAKILTDKKKLPNQARDNFWLILRDDEKQPLSMWTYYQSDEKQSLPRKFDVPQFQEYGNYLVARSGGSFGLLDSSKAEVLPFIYKRIVYSNGVFFVRNKDDFWSAWTPEKGLIPLNCRDISLSVFSNGRLIFDADKIGVLSNNLEIIVPLSHPRQLNDTLSLRNLLGAFINDRNYFNWKASIIQSDSPLSRLMNNQTIIDMSLVYSTRHYMHEQLSDPNKAPALSPVYVDPVSLFRSESRTIDFNGQHFCSFTRTTKTLSFAQSVQYNRFQSLSSADDEITHTTVILERGVLRTAKLSDLFIEGTDYEAQLDYLLTQVINKKQLFGVQCLNLPQILTEYKANFRLERNGISFSLKNENKPIYFDQKELRGYLKPL